MRLWWILNSDSVFLKTVFIFISITFMSVTTFLFFLFSILLTSWFFVLYLIPPFCLLPYYWSLQGCWCQLRWRLQSLVRTWTDIRGNLKKKGRRGETNIKKETMITLLYDWIRFSFNSSAMLFISSSGYLKQICVCLLSLSVLSHLLPSLLSCFPNSFSLLQNQMLHMYQYALYYYKYAAALRPTDGRMWCAVGNCLCR